MLWLGRVLWLGGLRMGGGVGGSVFDRGGFLFGSAGGGCFLSLRGEFQFGVQGCALG